MELVDLYDENRAPLGKTAERYGKKGPGEYRTVVHVCLFDSQGRLLIQKRTAGKRVWPEMWDVSVGGGVDAGETSRQGAEREFREELQGRKADLEDLKRYIEERKHDLVIKQKELEQITEETKEEEVVIRQQAHSLEEGIEPRLLAAFKRIRKGTRNGLGVVAVKNAACGGCFNRLTPQRQLDIRMRKKVIVCEYCGRILVDPEMVDPEY